MNIEEKINTNRTILKRDVVGGIRLLKQSRAWSITLGVGGFLLHPHKIV